MGKFLVLPEMILPFGIGVGEFSYGLFLAPEMPPGIIHQVLKCFPCAFNHLAFARALQEKIQDVAKMFMVMIHERNADDHVRLEQLVLHVFSRLSQRLNIHNHYPL